MKSRWRSSLGVVAIAGCFWSTAAWADIPPPDDCSGAGTACSNAGEEYDQPGTCMQRTCTKGPPGEQYSYECLLCEVNGVGGKDSGVVDAGQRDSGLTKDSGTRKDSGTGLSANKDSGSGDARDSGGTTGTSVDAPTVKDGSTGASSPQSDNDASSRPVPTTVTPDPIASSSGEKPPVTPADTTSPEGGSKGSATETSAASDEDDGCNVSRVNGQQGGVAAWLAFGLGLLWLARRK